MNDTFILKIQLYKTYVEHYSTCCLVYLSAEMVQDNKQQKNLDLLYLVVGWVGKSKFWGFKNI